jgi:hypothetical protein
VILEVGAENATMGVERYAEYDGCIIESHGRVYLLVQDLEAKKALLEIR